MPREVFHPLIRQWFDGRFGAPTEPQRLGWPYIAAGRHTLIAAPTGSGKTLAAFLVCIDRLWRDWLDGRLAHGIQVVYVSPLKALSNDIERNLQQPLDEIRQAAAAAGHDPPPIRTAVRTGDTPPAARQAMLRRPPHILVTTPESLYLLLTSQRARELLPTVQTVIVDEIHALARDKRGSHLSLSLERLAALCPQPPVRIGLSATQRPIEKIARFLVGSDCTAVNLVDDASPSHLLSPSPSHPPTAAGSAAARDVFVVDSGHVRQLDLAIETPPSELSAVCSHEQWDEVYGRLVELIVAHRSTLVFVNTRRLAERVSHRLRELLGDESVAGHHGSLSRAIRWDAEQRLKNGQLKAIVATASLEMGIDIGYIDLVCQLGSPRSIATFLQRVGRSGHSLGLVPKGRLFPLTRDELLECMALVRAVHGGRLDEIEIPHAPLDILAQQIVAAAACQTWQEDELLALVRRAWPFRDLSDGDFEAVLTILSEGLTPTTRRGAYLHRDRIHNRLRARRNARLAAVTSGGAIPETAEYRVVAQPDETFVGSLDEDFAIESLAGDVFLLGNTSWRIQYVRAGQVVVRDAEGAPPNVPFWFGEGPGRTIELSDELSRLRADIAAQGELAALRAPSAGWSGEGNGENAVSQTLPEGEGSGGPLGRLRDECGVGDWALQQAVSYVQSQLAAIGLVPTNKQIVFERFFDESGGMQLVIHAPLGARINRAWGLALRKRFCRSFDFELQAAATDNGIVLSIGPQHSFPIESLFRMIGPQNARHLLEQAVLAAPMFQVRWRWNVTRALAVLRNQGGKKVPPHLQRFRADDLLAAAFPETVGCLENHHGDVDIPDHPLVRQTMHDCLTEAMDVERWMELLAGMGGENIRLVDRDTHEPSPFCYELLNANPYAFLDDAPLEERRTRAVATRRSFTPEDVRDLASLDPQAIAQVRAEAWPVVRDADELHEALSSLVLAPAAACADWQQWLDELVAAGRAATICDRDGRSYWLASECWPAVRALWPEADCRPPVHLPPQLDQPVEASDALVALLRGQLQFAGPVTAQRLADDLNLEAGRVTTGLEVLEGRGTVLRGRFTSPPAAREGAAHAEAPAEWCDRRLLARIHRLTMDGLRRRIKPVSPEDYMRFLLRHHRLADSHWVGQVGVREAVAQLQGCDLPAGVWEKSVLAARVADYDPQWLDQLFLAGEVAWGRLRGARRDEETKASAAAMTRMVPISLLLRNDLAWLLPPAADDGQGRGAPPPGAALSTRGQQVLDTLSAKGALFFPELLALTELLPAHLEEALRELAGRGLVTSDAFAAIRAMVGARRHSRRAGRRAAAGGLAAPAGRWSRFPGHLAPPPPEAQRLEQWCRLLLRRWGVLFRDLLAREPAAPPWRELVWTLRRMELRGVVRGGRFVSGVAGEQFAEEAVVGQLRAVRDQPDQQEWVVISAADPLNLTGIVIGERRVAATHNNTLVLRGGRCVAAKQARQIEFFEQVDADAAAAMRRALQTGRSTSQSHIRPAWIDGAHPQAARPAALRQAPSRTIRRP